MISSTKLSIVQLEAIAKFVADSTSSDIPNFMSALPVEVILFRPCRDDNCISTSLLFSAAWMLPLKPDNLNLLPLARIVVEPCMFLRIASPVELKLLVLL